MNFRRMLSVGRRLIMPKFLRTAPIPISLFLPSTDYCREFLDLWRAEVVGAIWLSMVPLLGM